MDRALAGSNLTTLDLDVVWVLCRDVTDSNIREGEDIAVDRRYGGVGCGVSAETALVGFARDVALECARRAGGCDWDDVDVRDYARQSEYLEYRRFGPFLVVGQVERVVVDDKSRMSAYGSWKMRMAQRENRQ